MANAAARTKSANMIASQIADQRTRRFATRLSPAARSTTPTIYAINKRADIHCGITRASRGGRREMLARRRVGHKHGPRATFPANPRRVLGIYSPDDLIADRPDG